MAGEKESKGKRQRTGRKHSKVDVYKIYEVSGNSVNRKRKSCPRCGAGTFLSEHKGRLYCGKCAYTIFDRRESKEESKPEEVAKPVEKQEE